MVAVMTPHIGTAGLIGLFTHFFMLSLLAVGGAISTAPDMQRYLVVDQHWLTDAQFSSSIAIAQAAPGPNVLFVAVLGWNVAGPLGVVATMAGCLLPSTLLSLWATRWGEQRQASVGVRAFKAGMVPITLGLLLSTGWVLALPYIGEASHRAGALALIAVTLVVMMRTRLSPMWLVGLGAAVGAMGWA